MKIEKNLLPKSIVELIIEEDTKNVAKHRQKAIAHIEKNADIKGFRKGAKIPENIIIRQYGEDHINTILSYDNIFRDFSTFSKWQLILLLITCIEKL